MYILRDKGVSQGCFCLLQVGSIQGFLIHGVLRAGCYGEAISQALRLLASGSPEHLAYLELNIVYRSIYGLNLAVNGGLLCF